MLERLWDLVVLFTPLSLIAVGGANSILPDVHRQVVLVHNWMTEAAFADAFTLAQAVPGPNILVVCLIGWNVAGLSGAVVALVATTAPTSVLALIVARGLGSPRIAAWRQRLQVGLAPLTLGLVLASGVVLARSADNSLVAVGLTVATTLVLLRTPAHPLLLMGVGAVFGLFGLV